MRNNRLENRNNGHFYKAFQPVKSMVDGKLIYGIIIGRFYKLPINGKKEEPYYIITTHGPAIWENHLEAVSEEEYQLQIKKLNHVS